MATYISSTRLQGPPIEIHCPMCLADKVLADVFEVRQVEKLLGLFPIHERVNVFLRCHACNGKLESTLGFGDLYNRGQNELRSFIRARITVSGFILSLIAIALWWLPLLGLLGGFAAIVVNRRVKRWTRRVSYIGLTLGILFHFVLIVDILVSWLMSPP